MKRGGPTSAGKPFHYFTTVNESAIIEDTLILRDLILQRSTKIQMKLNLKNLNVLLLFLFDRQR